MNFMAQIVKYVVRLDSKHPVAFECHAHEYKVLFTHRMFLEERIHCHNLLDHCFLLLMNSVGCRSIFSLLLPPANTSSATIQSLHNAYIRIFQYANNEHRSDVVNALHSTRNHSV
eukprot:COSAG02_NODE_1307_length_13340_cov_84.665282_11_plen_115_part_00